MRAGRRRKVLFSAGAVLAVLLAGAGGWWLNNLTHPTPAVHTTITGVFDGTITEFESDPYGGCVTRPGHRQVCSLFYIPQDEAPAFRPRVGERVYAIHESLYTGGGFGTDMLLLLPPGSPGVASGTAR